MKKEIKLTKVQKEIVANVNSRGYKIKEFKKDNNIKVCVLTNGDTITGATWNDVNRRVYIYEDVNKNFDLYRD